MPTFAAPGSFADEEGYGPSGYGTDGRSRSGAGWSGGGSTGAANWGGGEPASTEGVPLARLLRRRWWALLLGAIVGVGGGYFYHRSQPPVYQSTAELTVSSRRTALPVSTEGGGRGDGTALSGDVIGDYLHRVQTGPLIERAVRDHNLDELPAFKGGGSPVGRILQGLNASQLSGTRVLRLSYAGGGPEETQAVLDAVVETFTEEIRDEGQVVSRETLRLITEARDRVLQDLEAAEAEFREFERSSPLVRGPEGRALNPHAADLIALDAARDGLELELSNLAAELESIRLSLDAGGRRAALAQMASMKRTTDGEGSSGADRSFEEQHFDLILELEEARETKGGSHPDIKRLENRLAALRRLHEDRLGAEETGVDPAASFLDLYVAAREERAQVLQTQIDRLDRQFVDTKRDADGIREAELREAELRNRRDRHAGMYSALVQRIAELDLSKDADPVRVAEIVPAGPGRPAQAPLIRALLSGGFLGLATAFGLAYLLETSDRRFTGPAELRAEFGLPLLGHVPENGSRAVKAKSRVAGVPDAGLATVLRPKSRLAESYRAVRTGLLSAAGGGARVVQITSPDQGDGKSTVAANVAVALGRIGKRTVLVDLDLRRPRVREMFGLPEVDPENPGVGSAEVIADPDRLDDALISSGQAGLWLLPCAAKPDHPAELLSSEAYETFLEVLRQKFDFVLLDTPPVLAVSDPAATARKADGVTVVTRLHPRTRRRLGESLDTLDQAGAKVLGLVVNALPSSGEYAREVQGGYSGGTGYGSRSRQNAYYTDEHAPVAGGPAAAPLERATNREFSRSAGPPQIAERSGSR